MIIVVYTSHVPDPSLLDLLEVKAASNIKDADKIAADVAKRKAALTVSAAQKPYTGEVENLAIIDTVRAVRETWTKQAAAKGKVAQQTPAERFVNYMKEHYGATFESLFAPSRGGLCPPVLVGFDIRMFVKLVAAECTKPGSFAVPPLGMWYDNRYMCDLVSALIPSDTFTPQQAWSLIMSTRMPNHDPEVKAKWVEYAKTWQGPHQDLAQDLFFTMQFLAQLGILTEESKAREAKV